MMMMIEVHLFPFIFVSSRVFIAQVYGNKRFRQFDTKCGWLVSACIIEGRKVESGCSLRMKFGFKGLNNAFPFLMCRETSSRRASDRMSRV